MPSVYDSSAAREAPPSAAPSSSARRLEVEVGRAASRTRGAGEDHAQHIPVLVLGDQLTESKQLLRRPRLVPSSQVDPRPRFGREGVEAGTDVAKLGAQHLKVVVR